MNTSSTQRGGFTLLELVCALFVLTLAGFGAIQLYNVAYGKILEMREFDVATEVLRSEMEQLHTLPFDAIASREGQSNVSPALESLDEPIVAVEVEDVDIGLKEVAVSLRWQGRQGRWMTRTLTTRIANPEAGQ